MRAQPIAPTWPPGPFVVDGALLPCIGVDVFLLFLVRSYLMVAVRVSWRIDDAGVVAAIGQYERHIGVSQHLNLIDRAPGRHMVSDVHGIRSFVFLDMIIAKNRFLLFGIMR